MWQEQKIGILGGGQLGVMLIRAAIDYGLHISVLDADPDAPCARYASNFQCGDPMDYDTVMTFGKRLHILTIEKEAVNVKALRDLEAMGIKVHPGANVVGLIQDKWIQKQFLQNSGLPVVSGVPVLNREELLQHTAKLPAVLKRCTAGYDGKGVMMLHSEADIDAAFDAPCVLEERIAIKQELSVIVSRNASGVVECYDPVMMIFNKEKFILDFQLCPANIPPQVALEACNIAIRVAEALELVGILAVEMFITEEGKLLVNELAPRPHNSGHHTIEACATSQYEQHLRAILGLPLGDTRLKTSSVMINIIEPAATRRAGLRDAMRTLLGLSDAHVHWYGKTGGKEGRKMGHITITEDTIDAALSKAVMVRHMLKHGEEATDKVSMLKEFEAATAKPGETA